MHSHLESLFVNASIFVPESDTLKNLEVLALNTK